MTKPIKDMSESIRARLMQKSKEQWKAYMKRSVNQDLKFEDVLDAIKVFLWPVYQALVQEREFFGSWSAQKGVWENF